MDSFELTARRLGGKVSIVARRPRGSGISIGPAGTPPGSRPEGEEDDLPFDGLTSLYVVSALFGLSQGGIVPSYALIVRQYFPAREAGGRIGLVLMASVIGMAIGGWMSGEIYDLTGSYQAAFLNGIAWNLLNMSIAIWLLLSRRKSASPA